MLTRLSRCIFLFLAWPMAAQQQPYQVIPDFSHMPDTGASGGVRYQQFDKTPLKFTATTQQVLVPVVVTDKDGKPISGLKLEAFQLLENGKEQKIAHVEEMKSGTQTSGTAPHAPNEFTNRTADEAPLRLVIIALDLVNTPFVDQARARWQLVRYLSQNLDPNSLYQLVAIENNGLRVLHDYTQSTNALIAELKNAESKIPTMQSVDRGALRNVATDSTDRGPTLIHEGAPSPSGNGDMSGRNNPDNPQGIAGANVAELGLAANATIARWESEYSSVRQADAASSTLSALQQIASRLSGVPGRKSLIWVTGGFPFSVDPRSGAIGEGVAFSAYQHVMQQLDNEMIAVYPVDARGLLTDSPDAEAKLSKKQNAVVADVLRSESDRQRDILDTMRAFADMTGGRAFVNTNDTTGAIREAAADASTYYLLSYPVDKTNKQAGWRKLNVKVGDYRTRARQGYYMTQATLDPSSSAKYDIDVALTSPFVYTGLPLKLTVNPPAGAGDKRKLEFAMMVPPKTATVDADQNNHMNLEIAYALRNSAGKDAGHKGVTYNLNLNPQQLAAIVTSGVGYNDTVELAPGNYTLTMVVRDNLSGRIGSVQAPIEVK